MFSVFWRRKILFVAGIIVVVSLAAMLVAPRQEVVRRTLPAKLSDGEFWNLIAEFSELDGYFRSENFVSNESAFQRVIPALKQQVKPGGVYLGVGPEQNFTYVAALEPRLAFIVDIRRQNMLLHLMYKAIFELSSNRTEFLSKLFARPIPKELSTPITVERLFDVFERTPSDAVFARTNLSSILSDLRERHHFDLSSEDSKTIEFVYNAFVSGGPEIRYSFPNQYAWRRFPSYSDLMLETDGTAESGTNHSYLASEDNFQAIKGMESENRIIPIVGDFAGEKALPSVSKYVRTHGATVSTFYASNVEFYLFQSDADWRRFFNTVAAMPLSSESVFIRSYFNNYGLQFPNPPGWLYPPPQSYTLLDSMPGLVSAFSAGRIRNYFDVVRRSAP
jgi:hypothetical protein